MKSLLFGVSETDPLTYAGITLVLVVVALAACYSLHDEQRKWIRWRRFVMNKVRYASACRD
jgi:hypothetical protein